MHSRDAHAAEGQRRAGGPQSPATRADGADALAELRQSSILIAHPLDGKGEALLHAVKRFKCRAELVWPVPALPPHGFDFALVALDSAVLMAAPWLSGAPALPVVALVDAEKGLPAKVLRLSNAQAVLVTPCNQTALLSNLILARHQFSYERRLQNKVAKLEETLHASRQIEQAKLILMQQRKLRPSEAYDYLRRQAMSRQTTVAAISTALVDAYGLID